MFVTIDFLWRKEVFRSRSAHVGADAVYCDGLVLLSGVISVGVWIVA